jgi:hypothetical protein
MPYPHHFGMTDPDSLKVKSGIRIRIRIKAESRIRTRIRVEVKSRELRRQILINLMRNRIRIRTKGKIRFQIWIRIKTKGWIRNNASRFFVGLGSFLQLNYFHFQRQTVQSVQYML